MEGRIVCWWSHGSTSTMATDVALMLLEKDPREKVIACITLEDEHPDNIRIAKQYEEYFFNKFGVRMTYITNEEFKGESGHGSVTEVIKKVKYMSGVRGAPCTARLKKEVRKNFERDDDTHVFGFHIDEAHRPDQILDAEPDLDLFCPLIEMGFNKQDALDYVAKIGLGIPVMYQLGYNNNNPCTLDTRVSTSKGVFPIGDLLGSRVEMFGRKGLVEADINYMGEQPVLKLSISKKGMTPKTLRFTHDHKWYNVSRNGKRIDGETQDLRVGDFLPVCDFGGLDFTLDKEALMWGFCVGDGSLSGSHAAVRAFGEKWRTLKSLGVEFTSHHVDDDMKYLGGLPRSYKEDFILPTETTDKKMSFLAGLFLADGSCNIQGQTCISTCDNVEKLKELLDSCGLGVTSIVEVPPASNTNSKGVEFKRSKVCYSLHFRAPQQLILKPSHKQNFKSDKNAIRGWRIDTIVEDGVQPVACATVVEGLPEFTLEDQILTGNCIGCVKAAGAGYWNKIREDFPEVFRTRSRQEKLTGAKMIKVSANKLMNEYPDTFLAVINGIKSGDLNTKIDTRGSIRIPLRYLPTGLGNHKTEHTWDCGIFCELDDTKSNPLRE